MPGTNDKDGRSPGDARALVYAVDQGLPFIGNVIGYSGKDGDMRDKFEKYGHAFVMKTGPRSQVLCIDRPEDITTVLNSKAFMPAWPRACPFLLTLLWTCSDLRRGIRPLLRQGSEMINSIVRSALQSEAGSFPQAFHWQVPLAA